MISGRGKAIALSVTGSTNDPMVKAVTDEGRPTGESETGDNVTPGTRVFVPTTYDPDVSWVNTKLTVEVVRGGSGLVDLTGVVVGEIVLDTLVGDGPESISEPRETDSVGLAREAADSDPDVPERDISD